MALPGSDNISDLEDDSNTSYPKSVDLADSGHSEQHYFMQQRGLSDTIRHLTTADVDLDSSGPFLRFNHHTGLQYDSSRHQTNGSTSDDSDSNEIIQRGPYADAKMRVGKDYQAVMVNFTGAAGSRCRSPDRAMCVWTPLPDETITVTEQLNTYLDLAHSRYGYSMEQALGLLFWHRHNLELATADLPNFTPYPDEWTHEEQLVFEQAFGFQGKQFHKIKQALPDKTVPHLVKYYYQWKKTRTKLSMLDRRDHMDDSGSEYSDGDIPEIKPGWKQTRRPRAKRTSVTGQEITHVRRKIPRGIFLDCDAFVAMSVHSDEQNSAILLTLDNQLTQAKSLVQKNRADISQKYTTLLDEVAAYREPEIEGTISAKWTEEELLLAVQGVRRYGKDYRAIAQLLGNKTEGHVRQFCINYRSKYNLDDVLAEWKRVYSNVQSMDKSAS